MESSRASITPWSPWLMPSRSSWSLTTSSLTNPSPPCCWLLVWPVTGPMPEAFGESNHICTAVFHFKGCTLHCQPYTLFRFYYFRKVTIIKMTYFFIILRLPRIRNVTKKEITVNFIMVTLLKWGLTINVTFEMRHDISQMARQR